MTGEISVEDGAVGKKPPVLFELGIEKLKGGVPVGKGGLELLDAVTGETGDDDGPVNKGTLLDLLHDGR